MTLIVVSGAPATGKSTIAAALAAELRWPLLSLDPVKETWLTSSAWATSTRPSTRRQTPGRPTPGRRTLVGPAGRRGGRDHLPADRAVPRRRRRRLVARRAAGLALAAFAGAVEVFCRCPPELAARRMRDRRGVSRHPIHRDVMNPAVADRAAELARTVMPLGLGAALIEVDTGQEGATARAVAAVGAALYS